MDRFLTIFVWIIVSSLLIITPATASSSMQDEEKKSENPSEEKTGEKSDKKEKKKDKTLAETVKDMEKHQGLFNLYRNKKTGSVMMEVSSDQIGKEFIYFAFIEDGVLEARSRRGSPVAEDVFVINKYFDRLEFVKKNVNYYMDPESDLARGGMANITDAVLASIKIKATSKDKSSYLIPADSLFLGETLVKLSYNLNPKKKPFEQFNMGKLSKERTKYNSLGVYPENLDVRSDYVYTNPKPFQSGSARIIDARSITITVQHAFLKMPENDFVPRLDDARIGYFGAKITDLNSYDITPYRDLISRWNLVKKDPDAALSEPVEPITWWIENTTPKRYREIMRQGILRWNLSFEKAGFKNAVVVNIQPDDADWNADDVRYNVVRWSATPGAGSAFGPSYINPRTGQILGADVMFEKSFITSYALRGDILGNPDGREQEIADTLEDMTGSMKYCSLGYEMSQMATFGRLAIEALDADDGEVKKINEQMLYELMLHEVGHTLGLNHNMKASQYRSNEDIHNAVVTGGITTASIMDYTALNMAPPGVTQGDYFATKPGPYDDWAIQFGYDPNLVGAARDAHLARSAEPQLTFGNDADDMRSPGRGIDPYVNVWDLTSDAMAFAEDQFDLVEHITPKLMDKIAEDGKSYAKLRIATSTMISYKRRGAGIIANYIGGVRVDRSVQGQAGAADPYTVVPRDKQKRAMKILRDRIFAPNAFVLPADLIAHSAMQRRGFDLFYSGGNEDPKIHSMILNVQQEPLNRLMNASVTARISDTALYGNGYGLNEMMSDLTGAIFEADLAGSVNSIRQNLQVNYVNRLIGMMGPKGKYDTRSKAAAFAEMKRIEAWMKKRNRGDASTKAHRMYISHLIEKALDAD